MIYNIEKEKKNIMMQRAAFDLQSQIPLKKQQQQNNVYLKENDKIINFECHPNTIASLFSLEYSVSPRPTPERGSHHTCSCIHPCRSRISRGSTWSERAA